VYLGRDAEGRVPHRHVKFKPLVVDDNDPVKTGHLEDHGDDPTRRSQVLNPLMTAIRDLDQVRALMSVCLELDGGLPFATDIAFVERAFASGPGVCLRDTSGALIAAVALGAPDNGLLPVSGAVHPSRRRRGIGTSLVQWAIREAD
jgi:GNAT superfamily N-acetyltransferase